MGLFRAFVIFVTCICDQKANEIYVHTLACVHYSGSAENIQRQPVILPEPSQWKPSKKDCAVPECDKTITSLLLVSKPLLI
jgi:hypothetical protein